MKKNYMKLMIVSSLLIALCGCGKKEKKEALQILNDFDDVQGTITDAPRQEEYDTTINISDSTVKIHYELGEFDSRVSKPISATEHIYTNSELESICLKIFDDGIYTPVSLGALYPYGVPASSSQYDVTTTFTGTIDEQSVAFEYLYSTNSTYDEQQIVISALDADGYIDMKMIREVPDVLIESNASDLELCKQKLESLLGTSGFDDYTCVFQTNIINVDKPNTKEADGYKFVYRKKIDDTYGNWYNENVFYFDEQKLPSYYEYIEAFIMNNHIYNITISDNYVAEVTQDYQGQLQGLDKILPIADKQIEKNITQYIDELRLRNMDDQILTINVSLEYVPLKYGEEIAYTPVYIFSVADVTKQKATEDIVAAVSALDGESIITQFYYYPDYSEDELYGLSPCIFAWREPSSLLI